MLRTARVVLASCSVLLIGCGGSGYGSGSGDAPGTVAPGHTKEYRVPSSSMLPTYKVGQIVTADLDAYAASSPKRGDIVVFHPPAPANSTVSGRGPSGQCGVDYSGGRSCPRAAPRRSNVVFIKRVVAGPGDTIALRAGHVVLNGAPQTEPLVDPCHAGAECNFPTPITVPAGQYYLLGDNRAQSDDSRFWGPVPKRWIVGRIEVP